MNSDEERLEEMLKAVMETENAIAAEQEKESSMAAMPEITDDLSINGIPEVPTEEEMMVDPLTLLDMSEKELDEVLEKEGVLGEMPSGKQSGKEPLNMGDKSADMGEPRGTSNDREQAAAGNSFENTALDSGNAESAPEAAKEEEEAKKKPEKKKREKKEKKAKKEKVKKEKKEKKEKKDGLGKKLAAIFFGSDDDELDSEDIESAENDEQSLESADTKKGAGAKEKKKKEKKKKPPKKNEPDPKKAEKEKQKKAKSAEKAKKKAEKAEKAEQAAKEKRAEKKLPKKRVIVWVLFCASIGAGILLLNSVGMNTLHLTEARDAFYDKDFETAYKLLNGRELSEEDQLLFVQSSAILHLEHAKEAYENHLKLEKPVMALEDLLKGVEKYQELLQSEVTDIITPEATQQYQDILEILRENYGLSEDGALEINALESDYEYSLQLEALVNGEVYQSEEEIEQQQEEEAAKYPELEDMLPEEEEFFNDSSD